MGGLHQQGGEQAEDHLVEGEHINIRPPTLEVAGGFQGEARNERRKQRKEEKSRELYIDKEKRKQI